MTTEQIRDTEPSDSSESLPPIDPPEANPILGEITKLNQEEAGDQETDIEEPVAEQSVPEQSVTEVETPPAPETPPTPPTPPEASPQYSPDQVKQMEFQARQYEEERAKAAIESQTNNYKRQLEDQGFLPEHAEQAAGYYMQTQEYQAKIVKQADEYAQHIRGQMAASEHFVKKYSLQVDDLAALRKYNDPQSMEDAAKKISADRERDTELAKFRQAQVPAQQFDNSQGEPSVASNESGWLDRYNSGDRSPNSVAAARRAVGLE